jgi:hypothetical protein
MNSKSVRNVGMGLCLAVPACAFPSCTSSSAQDNCVFIVQCDSGLQSIVSPALLVVASVTGALLLLSVARLVLASHREELLPLSLTQSLLLFAVTVVGISMSGILLGQVGPPPLASPRLASPPLASPRLLPSPHPGTLPHAHHSCSAPDTGMPRPSYPP